MPTEPSEVEGALPQGRRSHSEISSSRSEPTQTRGGGRHKSSLWRLTMHVRTIADEQAELYYRVAMGAVACWVGYVTYCGWRFYRTYVSPPKQQ